jgi:hypothetical protein
MNKKWLPVDYQDEMIPDLVRVVERAGRGT